MQFVLKSADKSSVLPTRHRLQPGDEAITCEGLQERYIFQSIPELRVLKGRCAFKIEILTESD